MQNTPPEGREWFRIRAAYWRARREGPRRVVQLAARRVIRPAWFAGILLWLAGCMVPGGGAPPTPTPSPTATASSANTDADADTWTLLETGIERRVYAPSSGFFTRITAIRIDPNAVDFQVHYRPGDPQTISGWREQLPAAAVIFNTNFFDRNDEITGLLFADGVRYGDPFRRRGGTFYIDDGVPGIHSNLTAPYSGQQYDQAVQAFPMLMQDSQRAYFDTRPDRSTRRTVVAIDSEGRVVVLVTTFGGITLLDLAVFLAESDMNLVTALNLDGGGSSMLGVLAGDADTAFASFDPVPAVMAVTPR
jgi:exopolysaccharide biosynthesis protein